MFTIQYIGKRAVCKKDPPNSLKHEEDLLNSTAVHSVRTSLLNRSLKVNSLDLFDIFSLTNTNQDFEFVV